MLFGRQKMERNRFLRIRNRPEKRLGFRLRRLWESLKSLPAQFSTKKICEKVSSRARWKTEMCLCVGIKTISEIKTLRKISFQFHSNCFACSLMRGKQTHTHTHTRTHFYANLSALDSLPNDPTNALSASSSRSEVAHTHTGRPNFCYRKQNVNWKHFVSTHSIEANGQVLVSVCRVIFEILADH